MIAGVVCDESDALIAPTAAGLSHDAVPMESPPIAPSTLDTLIVCDGGATAESVDTERAPRSRTSFGRGRTTNDARIVLLSAPAAEILSCASYLPATSEPGLILTESFAGAV